jgi:DNA-binding SARP family transcriptional activator/tetratricopeptide (TPR) repeat protein
VNHAAAGPALPLACGHRPRRNPPTMHLHLASAPRVALANGPAQPLAALDAALLAWLAIEGPTPRARMAALLWPDKDADAARNSLRQRLFRLRRTVGVELVGGDATVLALADGIEHDLHDADVVLADVAIGVSGEFADWLALQRQRRRDRVRSALVELSEGAESARDWDDALSHAQELLALEPLSEDAHRRVMRLHYLRGDRAAALLAFDRCEQMLKDEIGARPSAETLALLETVSATANAVTPVHAAVPASVLRPPRMVGRARELAALDGAWRAGHVAVLVGEAGLGKSRLLHEFAAARRDMVSATGRPGDAGVPFATLARLLRAVAAGGAQALPTATRSEIARVLPEFEAGPPRATGEGQRLVLLRAVRALLATRPPSSTLIVDDLHFADAASLDLLAGLIDGEDAGGVVDDSPSLRWLLAWRPAEAGSPLQALHDRLVEQVRLVPIPLAPLDEAALAELVDSLGLPGIDGRALAAGLRQRTGGNPLFVLETLKQAWVERTLADLADARRLPRPLSVGRLIERRLAQLSPGALSLARVASIAGVDFTIELAESVLQAGAMQFADALNELEAAQVLRGTAFAHDLVFDAVRGSVPQAVAQLTHARVAAWLEPRGGEPARIARHWVDAGHDAKALTWLDRAAQRAGAAVRRREQIDFLDEKARIEQAAGDRAAAFDTLMRAAEIEVTLGDGAALVHARCDRLDALADDAQRRVRAAVQRSNLQVMRGFPAEAERVAAQALQEALREGVAEIHVAECRIALGTALSSQERAAEALVPFEAALGWVRAHAAEDVRCEFHGNLATTYDRLCRFEDGAAQHREAVLLAQKLDDYGNWAVCLSNFASNRTRTGAPHEADALLEQARRVYVQAAEPSAILGYLAIEHCVVHRQLGRYGRALRDIDDGIENLRRFAPGYEVVLLAHLATCWAHLGQWARLDRTLDEIGKHTVPSRTAVRVALLRRQADQALRRSSDVSALEAALVSIESGTTIDFRHTVQCELASLQADASALATLESLVEEAATLGHRMSQLPAAALAANLALELGDAPRALRHARAAWTLASQTVSHMCYPLEPWWHCARVFHALDDAGAAAEVCRRALDWIETAAAREVAPEFRDSFLHRNPVNRELLALAARRGVG